MPTPPVRTPDERQDALDEAIRVRQARAKLKKDVARNNLMVLELIDVGARGSGDKVAGGLRVRELLEAAEGIGPIKAASMLEVAGIDEPTLRLDRLTLKEATGLKDAFHAWLDN